MCADILKSQIKLMAPQNLDDTAEGGGQMTGTEIVSGNVNNLFPDISRLDRTYGRVSLRKAFLSIRTTDRATYYGSHAVLTRQAADPLVGVTFFSTENWFDMRSNAKDRMEAYLTKGPQYMGALYGNLYAGTKSIILQCGVENLAPDIGDVLVLKNSTVEEYIRVLDVDSSIQTLTDNNGTFQRQVIVLTIGVSLENDFTGQSAFRTTQYSTLNTTVYSSVVSDAATYYGITHLSAEALTDSLTLQLDDVFTPLLPASQSSTPIIDAGVSTPRNRLIPKGDSGEVTRNLDWKISSNGTLLLGEAIIPGTLKIDDGAILYDDGAMSIKDAGGITIGGIDYITGTITFGAAVSTSQGSGVWTYIPALSDAQAGNSGLIGIFEANRGYAYIFACDSLPIPLTMRIAYNSGNKWYVLQDVGGGRLSSSPSIDSAGDSIEVPDLGTGTINYDTGSVSLTLKYMPDIGSNIMITWGDNVDLFEVKNVGATATVYLEYTHTITWTSPIPGTVTINAAGMVSITDASSNGILYQGGSAVGFVNYKSGEMLFTTTSVPAGNASFSIGWDEEVTIEPFTEEEVPSPAPDPAGEVVTDVTVPPGEEVVPGTVNVQEPGSFSAFQLLDDGQGNLVRNLRGTGNTGIRGWINYITGEVTLGTRRGVWLVENGVPIRRIYDGAQRG